MKTDMDTWDENQSLKWCILNRGVGCIMSMIQLPVVVFFLCRNQYLPIDTYFTEPNLQVNSTALNIHEPIHTVMSYNTNVMPAFIFCSFLLSLFGTMTSYMDDTNDSLANELYEASNEKLATVPIFVIWHYLFAAIVAFHHILYAAILCAPFELHSVLLAAIPLVLSLHFLYTKKVPMAASDLPEDVFKVQYVLNTQIISVAYISSICVIISKMPYDPLAARAQALMSLVICDISCIFSVHMLETTPQLLAVVNSRLMYTTLLSVLNIFTIFYYKSSIQTQYA
jgi:hypothetical protein